MLFWPGQQIHGWLRSWNQQGNKLCHQSPRIQRAATKPRVGSETFPSRSRRFCIAAHIQWQKPLLLHSSQGLWLSMAEDREHPVHSCSGQSPILSTNQWSVRGEEGNKRSWRRAEKLSPVASFAEWSGTENANYRNRRHNRTKLTLSTVNTTTYFIPNVRHHVF